MIDLHIHSNYSDGSDTIEQILQQAQALKLNQIAITDHNTLEGALYAKSFNLNTLELITGIEISCDFNNQELHILGYFPSSQISFQPIYDLIEYNERCKYHAQLEMIHRLNNHGIIFTYEEMKAMFPNTILNRVHLAKMVVAKGFVQDVEAAFDQYLGKKQACYVASKRCSACDVIKAIHACNGLAYLAHPFQYQEPFVILDSLKNELDGIEVYHSSFNESQSNQLYSYAKKYDLKISGGSDYHGSNKKDVFMGKPYVDICHSIVF